MLDISDGIAQDARRLAASSGTGAEIHLEQLPRAAGASIEEAACGGEDYELLAALPPDAEVPEFATVVGLLTEGADVRFLAADGSHRDLHGWDHFR
jgi:thiamine-monophosphate kinase